MTIVIKNISEEQVKDLEWLFDSKVTRLPPHGRLIDAGALIKLLDNCMFPADMVTTQAVSMARNWLIDAPTIIESEGEE